MRERAEQLLKVLCAGLGLLLAVRLAMAAFHFNPLAGVAVPDLPSLPAETNAPAIAVSRNSSGHAGNSAAAKAVSKTNAPSSLETNMTPLKMQTPPGDPSPATAVTEARATTNRSGTNLPLAVSAGTNAEKVLRNASAPGLKTPAVPNGPAIESSGTNGSAKTNAVAARTSRAKKSSAALQTMFGFPGRSAPSLPPAIQARVDRITDSEILGPVIRPMPMALLGIAGNVAFLRSPSGQTGLVKEGEELGEIKLLKIGINRVLIERGGQKQEVTIFSGYGGESLLPKTTETRDETTTRN